MENSHLLLSSVNNQILWHSCFKRHDNLPKDRAFRSHHPHVKDFQLSYCFVVSLRFSSFSQDQHSAWCILLRKMKIGFSDPQGSRIIPLILVNLFKLNITRAIYSFSKRMFSVCPHRNRSLYLTREVPVSCVHWFHFALQSEGSPAIHQLKFQISIRTPLRQSFPFAKGTASGNSCVGNSHPTPGNNASAGTHAGSHCHFPSVYS